MKFLLIGDRHQSPHAPLTRIDDFEDTCRKKDNEILKIARDNGVEAILEAGDFFEEGRSRLPAEFLQQIIARWFGHTSVYEIAQKREELDDQAFLEYMKSINPIKLIGVAGNHELQGGAPESLPNTTLGLLNGLGYIQLPSKKNPIIFKDSITGKTIAITATSYHPLMDSPEYLSDYIIDEKLGDFHIHMVHGMLTDRSLGPERTQTLIDQIVKTKADITFCGHIHTGFRTIEKDGKYFVNPGSIIRLSATKAEMTRKVHVLLLEITDKIQITEIPLKSALPGSKVLTRDHLILKKRKKSISDFYNAEVESYKIEKSRNINDVLNDIMNKEGLDEGLKKSYQDKINSKKATLMTSIPEGKDTWIKSIEIENFQSHKYQKLYFDRYMNLLVGESDNGKSAILRALYWVYTGKPSGVTFVRYGCDSTSVSVELGNGIIIEHKVVLRPSDKTKVGKNVYTIKYPDGTEETGNTRLLPKVQELLGYCNFTIDESQSLDINFMRQGEGWFLISDDISSPQRAKIIGAIMNTSCVDACMKDCEKELKDVNKEITINNSAILKFDEEIATYNDLEEEKERLHQMEEKIAELNLLNKKIEQIQKIKEDIIRAENRKKELEDIILELTKNDYDSALRNLSSSLNEIILIESTYKSLQNSRRNMSSLETTISEIGDISRVDALLEELNQSLNIVAKITEIKDRIIFNSNEIRKNNSILSHKDSIENFIRDLKEIENLSKKIDTLIGIRNIVLERKKYIRNSEIIIKSCLESETAIIELAKLQKEILKISEIIELSKKIKSAKYDVYKVNAQISQMEKSIENTEKKRQEILSNIDICPICGQDVPHSH